MANTMRSPAMPQADKRSFKMSDDNTIEMVSKKDGKTVGEGKIVVAADGKTPHGYKHDDQRQGREGDEHLSLR